MVRFLLKIFSLAIYPHTLGYIDKLAVTVQLGVPMTFITGVHKRLSKVTRCEGLNKRNFKQKMLKFQEKYSFVKKNFRYLFLRMCERSQFNRTRRNLSAVIDQIFIEVAKQFEATKCTCEPHSEYLQRLIFKTRRRIETTFSQLIEQFNAERVFAKSFAGLCVRLLTKFLAFILCIWLCQSSHNIRSSVHK